MGSVLSRLRGGNESSAVPSSTPDSSRSPSPTSTVEYEDHETFETFQHKVRQLCHLLWPSYDPDDIGIERIKGGFSNRVIGIHVPERPPATSEKPAVAPEPPPASHVEDAEQRDTTPVEEDSLPPGYYVLRIPRFQSARLDYDRFILNLANTLYTTIGVPRVVAMDDGPSTTNPLGQPYMLQHRLLGQRLDEIWKDLNHQQRLCIVRDVASFFLEVQKATNPTGGLPDFERSGTSTQAIPTVDFKFVDDAEGSKRPIEAQHPVDMLCARLRRWDQKYSGPGLNDGPWLGLIDMVKSMQASNKTFGPDTPTYYFHHGDLFPRNIMVTTPDDKTAVVTGILDWDDVHFAPAVVAFAPAAWLWIERYWKDDIKEYMDEEAIWSFAQETPQNDEARELKALFEEIVGPEFLRYAYSPDAPEARKIWSCARERIGKSWVVDDLSQMVASWRSGNKGETDSFKAHSVIL
ncbi:hypothetical protein ACHAPT_004702 [Fusarium lateritium]